ncbi:hypothetical protein SAY87_028277 [Trapa incisa]|uniref:RHOMBOID-like protein n=1 Tax=Trapa incisa TaxID=236973 RepID=A0AAN7KZI0_9MYRT|nr:hypothetical protein SAY87_028277 [Trapa incisa]
MEGNSKSDVQMAVKPKCALRVSFDFNDYPIREKKARFFRSASHQHRDTWIISLFAILHVVIFISTMVVNNCVETSHGDCAFKVFGRLSFQPLSENPLLGPSASTLDYMGALQRKYLSKRFTWRLFTFPCLHAGFIHLFVNLVCVLFIGIHMEQVFGSLRIGMIYILSAFLGSLFAALFVQGNPQVGASGALFGLLGATISHLIRSWKLYTDKFAALAFILSTLFINSLIGMLPFIDNFASIAGFISGQSLGFALLYNPEHTQAIQNKAGLFEYGIKISAMLKQKLDKPIQRIIGLLVFALLFVGCLVAVLKGIDLNQYCSWCRYADCVLSKRWSCNEATSLCEDITFYRYYSSKDWGLVQYDMLLTFSMKHAPPSLDAP